MPVVPPELMRLLVCPACRGKLFRRGSGLACKSCARGYRVQDGIPVLLVDADPSPEDRPVSGTSAPA